MLCPASHSLRILFLISCCVLTSIGATGQVYYFTNNGRITFHSDAPQEIISATSDAMQGLIDEQKRTFVFKVLLRTFEGFNSALQREHFNEKYLESEKYPEAVFAGKIIEDVEFGKDGTFPVRAKGKFKVHGVEQERIIKAKLDVRNGTIRLSSSFSVMLVDHNIKVPKVVHDKIASEITVDIEAVLKQKVKQ